MQNKIMSENQDYSFLYKLEKSLHLHEVRTDIQELRKLLSPTFYEFGSSGNVWTLENILARLPLESKQEPLESFDYQYKRLAVNVVLVTYKTSNSLRSSIWKSTETGWQLEFHQGTPIKTT